MKSSTRFRREVFLIAVLGDGDALDQLHDKIGPVVGRRSRVEHLGNVGMIHHRQRLPFLLEAGNHPVGVHAFLDDFQGHPALHRLFLLCQKHRAHAALAEFLQELVWADARAHRIGCLPSGRVFNWQTLCLLTIGLFDLS
jgi:hypothetical protein